MLHTDQQHMLNEMLDDPAELIVDSKSHHAALYTTPDGDALLMSGDFSGPEEEMEDKIHRFAEQMKSSPRRY